MCYVFSWIVDKAGKVWFCDDRDCEVYMANHPEMGWKDVVGHETIRSLFGVKGKEYESVTNVPAEIRASVNDGRCDKLLSNNGWKGLRYDSAGNISSLWWPGEFIESLKAIKWLDNRGTVNPAWKVYETRSAAGSAALSAAWDAALSAAGSAAGSAAWDAAWDAAGSAAWDAAWSAAWDAALYAKCLMAWGAKSRNKHFAHAEKRMSVWKAGYGLLCDVNGVLYVYKRP